MQEIVRTRFKLSPALVQHVLHSINDSGEDASCRQVEFGGHDANHIELNLAKCVAYVSSISVDNSGNFIAQIKEYDNAPASEAFKKLHDKLALGMSWAGEFHDDDDNALDDSSTFLGLYYYCPANNDEQ